MVESQSGQYGALGEILVDWVGVSHVDTKSLQSKVGLRHKSELKMSFFYPEHDGKNAFKNSHAFNELIKTHLD